MDSCVQETLIAFSSSYKIYQSKFTSAQWKNEKGRVVGEQSVGLGPDIGGLAGWGRSAGEKMMAERGEDKDTPPVGGAV